MPEPDLGGLGEQPAGQLPQNSAGYIDYKLERHYYYHSDSTASHLCRPRGLA
jgi:hypothetical protein